MNRFTLKSTTFLAMLLAGLVFCSHAKGQTLLQANLAFSTATNTYNETSSFLAGLDQQCDYVQWVIDTVDPNEPAIQPIQNLLDSYRSTIDTATNNVTIEYGVASTYYALAVASPNTETCGASIITSNFSNNYMIGVQQALASMSAGLDDLYDLALEAVIAISGGGGGGYGGGY